MKLYLKWGAILAAALIVLGLVGYLLGFQTTRMETGRYYQWLAYPITFAVLWVAARAVRDARGPAGLSYGQGLGAISMIALFGSAIAAVYTFIHFQFINTEFASYVTEMVRNQLEAKNMSEDQINAVIKMQSFFFHPPIMAVFALITQFILCFVFGLIISAIVKRPPAEATPPPLAA